MSSRAINKTTDNKKDDDDGTETTNTNINKLVKKKPTRKERRKNNNPENDTLFFKIWRNNVLRNEIYERVRLIKHIRFQETKFTVKSLQEYNHRDYLQKITLINDKNNIPDLSNPLSLPTPLPLPTGVIPVTTEYLELNNYCLINENDLPEGVVNIKFGRAFRNINFSHIPKSIQKISFSRYTNVTISDGGNGLNEFNNLNHIVIDIGSLDLLNHLNRFPNLRILCINGSDGRELVIPEGIRCLIFGSTFNSNSPTVYPQSLRSIRTGLEFTKQFDLNALPLDIEEILIGSYRVHKRFNEFSNFKKLKQLHYYSGKPHEKLDGKLVYDILPIIDQVILNSTYRFKNKNGTLILEETYQNLIILNQQLTQEQQEQPINN